MFPFVPNEHTPENIKAAYATFLQYGIRIAPGTSRWDEREILNAAQHVRDVRIREVPILPGAIATFIELASTREWAVAGKPRAVTRAVESLNESETYDPDSGRVTYGFEQFTRRRAMDHITIGRSAFAFKRRNTLGVSPLEYLDPTILHFEPKKSTPQNDNRYAKDAKDVWFYANNDYYHNHEVFLHHPLPVGVNRFTPPIYFLMPSASLAWLLQEHNIASLDGRKIRDIFFVGNQAIHEGVKNALIQQAALWSGESVEKIGIPVVHLNVQGSVDISKLIYRMGISEVPEKFNPEQFIDFYVNQIASALGIALRHFWNTNTATTNRAVEEVAERRQESKGPAAFIRSEERLINNSGFLEQFGKGRNRVRFGYVEEVDVSTRLGKAEYLERISKALNLIAKVFGVQINMDSYLAWMQSVDALPPDMTLIDAEAVNTIEKPDDNLSIDQDEQIAEGNPEPNTFDDAEVKNFPMPDYDEILLSGDGVVLDRRLKTFSVFSTLAGANQLPARVSGKSAWEEAIHRANSENQFYVRSTLLSMDDNLQSYLDNWLEVQLLFPKGQVEVAIQKCFDGDHNLTEGEQDVIDYLSGEIEEWLVEREAV